MLSNDSDPDGPTPTASLVSSTSHGTLTLSADGSFVYAPSPGYVGIDSFTYEAVDSDALSSEPATVLIAVTNTPPVAANDFYKVKHDESLTVTAPGVLGNDYDADSDTLSVTLVGTSDPAAAGTVVVNGDGSIAFTPAVGYVGPVTLTYVATDGVEEGEPATIRIDVLDTEVVANDDAYVTTEDVSISIPAAGVLANDSNPEEEDPLTAALVSPPSHGSLVFNTDGSFDYTPDAGFVGVDQFTYQASAGEEQSKVAAVQISVVQFGIDVEGSDKVTNIAYVPINGNNTNGSALVNTKLVPSSVGIPTIRDYASNKALAVDDPELKKVTLTATPLFPDGAYAIAITSPGKPQVRFWVDARKTRPLDLSQVYTRETLPREFWVEGLEMTSMTAEGGEMRLRPDVTITLFRTTTIDVPGVPIPVPVINVVATKEVIVTPVVQSFGAITGSMKIIDIETAGGKMVSIAVRTGTRAENNQTVAFSALDSSAVLMSRGSPGAGTLVQVAGFDMTAGLVNGAAGVTAGVVAIVDNKTVTKNALFVEDNKDKDSPAISVTQVIDTAARWETGGEPEQPDYLGQTSKGIGNDTYVIAAQDAPGFDFVNTTNKAHESFARGVQEMAVRFNFRLYLMWRYPPAGGQPSILFPLARLDWTANFRASRGATGTLVLTADSGITATTYTPDHTNPTVLTKPDFNLHFGVR